MGCACGWVGICGSDFGESFVFDENGTRRGRVHLLYPVLCVAQGWRRVRRGWHGFNG